MLFANELARVRPFSNGTSKNAWPFSKGLTRASPFVYGWNFMDLNCHVRKAGKPASATLTKSDLVKLPLVASHVKR